MIGAGSPHWMTVRRVLLVLAAVGLLQLTAAWEAAERFEFDLLSTLTAPPPPDVGVAVIGLDEPSFAALGQSPPLPRSQHARLIEALDHTDAAVLGVDILFPEARELEEDAALARALRVEMPVVLASADVDVQTSQVAQYVQRVASIFPEARHGLVHLAVDADGVVRRAPLEPDTMWRAMAEAAGRAFTPPPERALLRQYAPEVPMPYLHYTQALEPEAHFPPGYLRGRLLLLGQNTPVSGVDQFSTALRGLQGGTISGVFVHATALTNALAGDWIRPAPPLAASLAGVGALLLVAAATARRWTLWRALGASALAGLAVLVVVVVLFVADFWLSSLPALAALLLHLNLGAAESYWREARRRELLRQQFARYVPPTVVDTLAASDTAPRLSGERRELTLLFSDLAGFTAASENLPPETVAQELNAYFTAMTNTVHHHGGTLDKFIGDAVMAFWNAPLDDPDHARHALACALDMQTAMRELRARWAGGPFAQLGLRIGLHTGEAAVGHLGSEGRFTYTAVGDAVNTAARLEGANKVFGTGVLLSETTRARLGDMAARTLWLDRLVLSGRSSGLDVYTVCEEPARVGWTERLHEALLARRWDDARALCDQAPADHPDWQAQAARWQDRIAHLDTPPTQDPSVASGSDHLALAIDKA